MKKYIVNIVTDYSKNVIGGGATSKAPADILVLAKKSGFEELIVHNRYPKNKFIGYIRLLWKVFWLSKRLKEKSIVLFQYPFVNVKLMPVMLDFFKGHRLIGLIHDINSVREHGKLSLSEQNALSRFNKLYVHTDEMRQSLSEVLPQKMEYGVLGCFPYLADKNEEKRSFDKSVCFAGNLNKSRFLPRFVHENTDLKIILYGSIKSPNLFGDKATYMGHFLPDNIQHIKGSWGLVWDGEQTECCGGLYGDYLKIIAPHKFSMYLAAEMPVIVWRNSAMAPLVEKYGLGIVVDSLSDISKKIDALSVDAYVAFLDNIRNFVANKMNAVF